LSREVYSKRSKELWRIRIEPNRSLALMFSSRRSPMLTEPRKGARSKSQHVQQRALNGAGDQAGQVSNSESDR
jgi:hypothetical protein